MSATNMFLPIFLKMHITKWGETFLGSLWFIKSNLKLKLQNSRLHNSFQFSQHACQNPSYFSCFPLKRPKFIFQIFLFPFWAWLILPPQGASSVWIFLCSLTLKRKYKKLTLNEIWGQFDPKIWLKLTKLV